MRARGRAGIGDRVADPHRAAAQVCLDQPGQHQLLAEHRHLADLGLRPQHALVALPPRAVSGQPGGQARVAAVQPVGLRLAVREVEHGRVVGAAQLHLVKSAGGDQAAGEGAEPADPGWLVIPRADQADRRPPGERPAAEPGPADVKAAVDEHLEVEAGSGSEPQQPDAALGAVLGLRQLDPGNLLKPADAGQQLAPRPLPPPQVDHPTRPQLPSDSVGFRQTPLPDR